jgi:hypothetical protein
VASSTAATKGILWRRGAILPQQLPGAQGRIAARDVCFKNRQQWGVTNYDLRALATRAQGPRAASLDCSEDCDRRDLWVFASPRLIFLHGYELVASRRASQRSLNTAAAAAIIEGAGCTS